MATPSKASLVKDLKKAQIDIPASAKIADMKHRLQYWKGGEGYLFRLLKNPSKVYAEHPISLLDNKDKLYYSFTNLQILFLTKWMEGVYCFM